MKLYVWEDVLQDYTSGIMFALANSVEQAKEVILAKSGWDRDNIKEELDRNEFKVIDKPEGFFLYGGG